MALHTHDTRDSVSDHFLDNIYRTMKSMENEIQRLKADKIDLKSLLAHSRSITGRLLDEKEKLEKEIVDLEAGLAYSKHVVGRMLDEQDEDEVTIDALAFQAAEAEKRAAEAEKKLKRYLGDMEW